jgi:hypothetical protein
LWPVVTGCQSVELCAGRTGDEDDAFVARRLQVRHIPRHIVHDPLNAAELHIHLPSISPLALPSWTPVCFVLAVGAGGGGLGGRRGVVQ